MTIAILIFLFFLEPILSDDSLSWEDYRNINLVKEMTLNKINHRRKVYLENLAKIQEHNDKFRKGLVTYSMKMNEFGHLTEKEFLKKYTGPTGLKDGDEEHAAALSKVVYNAPKNITLPESVDWRLKGVVTQVKSQNECRACYAFGSVASLESQYSIKYKKLVEFSEQQIIDCSRNWGCIGGYIGITFEYVRDIGLTTNASYPYEAKRSTCRIKKQDIVLKLKNYIRINPYSIHSLQAAVALHGPVTITVNTNGKWQFLSGKQILVDNWCGARGPADHILSVVGYNTSENGVRYWIIKNSWGSNWGDEGYVYLEHTKADKCGIVQFAVIPQLK